MKKKFILLVAFALTILMVSCGGSSGDIYYVTAKNGLTMRDKASVQGKKIMVIPGRAAVIVIKKTGKEMTIAGKTDNWAKVKYKGKVGYSFAGFLSRTKPPVQKDPVKKASQSKEAQDLFAQLQKMKNTKDNYVSFTTDVYNMTVYMEFKKMDDSSIHFTLGSKNKSHEGTISKVKKNGNVYILYGLLELGESKENSFKITIKGNSIYALNAEGKVAQYK